MIHCRNSILFCVIIAYMILCVPTFRDGPDLMIHPFEFLYSLYDDEKWNQIPNEK